MNREDVVSNAERFLLQGDLEAAIGEYVRLVESHPQDVDLLFTLAKVELEAGRDIEARAVLTRLLTIAPERHQEVTRLAEEALDRGELESAFGCIEVVADAAILGGDWTAAAEALRAFLRSQPEHSGALARLEEISAETEDTRIDTVGVPLEKPAAPAEVDLTHALTSLGDTRDAAVEPETPAAPPAALEDVFGGMRWRASHDQDAAEQYELGMQLLREGAEIDAVFHLQAAARMPKWGFRAALELGRLYVRRGELPEAVEWLERTVDAAAPSPDDAYGALYELADVLEQLGEPERSLAVLMELEAAARGYRDAAERIQRLSRARAGSSLP